MVLSKISARREESGFSANIFLFFFEFVDDFSFLFLILPLFEIIERLVTLKSGLNLLSIQKFLGDENGSYYRAF